MKTATVNDFLVWLSDKSDKIDNQILKETKNLNINLSVFNAAKIKDLDNQKAKYQKLSDFIYAHDMVSLALNESSCEIKRKLNNKIDLINKDILQKVRIWDPEASFKFYIGGTEVNILKIYELNEEKLKLEKWLKIYDEFVNENPLSNPLEDYNATD